MPDRLSSPPPTFRRSADLGAEPDPRFTLANERTFLGWMRTSAALVALALAALALDLPMHDVFSAAVAALWGAASLSSALWGWHSWRRTQLHLRLDQPLPSAAPGAILVLGWFVAAAATLAAGSLASHAP